MRSLDNLVKSTVPNGWFYAAIALGLIITFQITVIVYNIFFHPLRHFPGPYLHRASKLPWAILHARGEQAFHTQRLHDQYGQVVRIGPNHLSFTNPQAWKDIYGSRPGGEMPKATLFTRPVRGVPTSILNADHEEHQLLRRALAHGFSDSSMRQQESTINKYVSMLIDRLRKECDSGRKVMNMAAWYNWTTFDLVSDLVFGESFHCLETIDYHPWVSYIFKAIRFHAVVIALRYSGLGELVQVIHKAGGFFALNNIREYTNNMLRSRLSKGKGRNDLFEGLAKRQDEWNLSFEKLSVNATILLLAGSETTATTLSGVTYLLLKHPETLAKLQQEIRTSFLTSDEITINSVGKLPYMLAALNETLRFYPPLTAGMVRVVPPGGAEIAGNLVCGGSLVEVQHWSVNHSKENWKDPWVFQPERFLVDGKKLKEQGDKLDAVQAFSVGPRNCIGRNLAYTEMRLILAKLIFNFDFKLADDSERWIEKQKAYNVWDRLPMNVYLTPAENSTTE